MHARRVLANDRKKALRTFLIFHRAVFECLNKGNDRGEGRAQFVRYVRKKFLPDEFEAFSARDVEENSECPFRSLSVSADRDHAKIEHLAFWSMCLHFDAAAFDTFKRIQERAVDRWVASQLRQALRVQSRK